MITFNNFFPSNVVTLFSDRSLDFSYPQDQHVLTEKQKAFIKQNTNVAANKVINIKQVHGDIIFIAKKESLQAPTVKKADAIITREKNLGLIIRTADCLSMFIYDEKNNVIALAHCGWQSTKKGLASKVILTLIEKFKSDPEFIKVAMGPSIRKCCYEVGLEFKKFFPDEIFKKNNNYFLDLAAVNKRQLLKVGIKEKNIYDCKVCTSCQNNYFSHRREGKSTGRMLSFISLKNKNV